MNSLIEMGEDYILKTYNRFPVVLDHGEGVHLYDTEGKEYLDFFAGIAVHALGYSNEAYKNGLKNQIDKLIHTSNLFYNEPAVRAAKTVTNAIGMKKVFFTNSGTEAVEGAMKVARKYAYLKDPTKEYEFIAMNNSFHGRSEGSLSVTGNDKYQEGFVPQSSRAVFAEFNNLEDVKSKITDKTCGIICEPIQGEGGIFPSTPEFLQGLRELCDEHDIILIFDEIQCGMGRSGSLLACQEYGVEPDVVTLAKALGCGIPVGAFAVNERADGILAPGDHGTTYGGNPLAAAAINVVFDEFERLDLVHHVSEIGDYLWDCLETLKAKYPVVIDHRGKGLIQGFEFEAALPVSDVVKKAMEKGLIIIAANNNTLRFLPSLVIEREHIDEMIHILDACLGELTA